MTTESNTITEGKCEFTNAMVYTELSHDQKTLVDSVSERDRIKAAERGFGLDKLVSDESCYVRAYVAENGYGLETLSRDESAVVRRVVARKGYGLDVLVDDPDEDVRMAACCAMSICKCTEEHWEGEGWYTFRTWVKTDGKFTVEDWESPEKPDPIFIESKDKFMEACKVPEGCECIVEHLNSDYELRSETYNSVKMDWTPEGNYDDVPCEYLEVTITFKNEDGDEKTDSETMEIPEGWDCTESEDYERLAKILCERNGLFYDKNNWKD